MKQETFEKYDVKRIFATAYAAKDEASVEDISFRVHEKKGLKKVRVTVGYGDETGWQLVKTYWATHLPTDEDLAALKGKRIADVLIQSGWNDEEKKWGKHKIEKFILADGEEVMFNGPKDEPGLTDEDDDE